MNLSGEEAFEEHKEPDYLSDIAQSVNKYINEMKSAIQLTALRAGPSNLG